MGRHLPGPQVADEGLDVVGLVGPERDPVPATATVEHRQRRLPLGRAGGMGERGIDDEPVAVLHERVPHEAEPALAAGRLAVGHPQPNLYKWIAPARPSLDHR